MATVRTVAHDAAVHADPAATKERTAFVRLDEAAPRARRESIDALGLTADGQRLPGDGDTADAEW